MTLKVVGAGLPRTGTASLKEALERLVGGRCYHMLEVLEQPEAVSSWQAALAGEPYDWDGVFRDYAAAVDWPASAFWRELSDAYPDATVLLSTRGCSDDWWRSVRSTVFEAYDREQSQPEASPFGQMLTGLLTRSGLEAAWQDSTAAEAAYERHNAAVRAAIPASRLLEWKPGDGWEPLCAALGVPVPDEPFPHSNTREEFRARAGFD